MAKLVSLDEVTDIPAAMCLCALLLVIRSDHLIMSLTLEHLEYLCSGLLFICLVFLACCVCFAYVNTCYISTNL